MEMAKCLCYLLQLYVVTVVHSFNIDVDSSLQFTINDKQSNFGYTVTLVKENQNDAPLVVGAPLFDNGNEAGGVFQCRMGSSTCTEKVLEAGFDARGKRYRNKQGSGFSANTIGQQVITCAPKFKKIITSSKKNVYSQPIGRCTVSDLYMKPIYFDMPCQNEGNHLYYFGHCLAGTSSSSLMYKNQPFYFLGAPGSTHLRGALFTLYAKEGKEAENPTHTPQDRLGRDSYMGYSVSAGQFSGIDIGDVVGGAPRAEMMTGKVILYNLKRNRRFTFEANIDNPEDQIGSYFGAAVCAVDLNNDKKDDVLIGSPYYSKEENEGRVYIYMNLGAHTVLLTREAFVLEGDGSRGGRFGSTITNIGDITGDGYNDIAIGAPGMGAVFIYNCKSSGIRKEYSQVIYASAPSSINGFGISISGGVDIDGNNYTDIAIGAYMEDKAYIFKTKPVVQLMYTQSADPLVPPEAESSNCKGPDGASYYCMSLIFNGFYEGVGTPSNYEVDATIDLDADKLVRKRMFMQESGKLVTKTTKTLSLRRGETVKTEVVVYVTLRVENDILSPMFINSAVKENKNPNNCPKKPCAVLDKYGQHKASTVVSYKTSCGSDSKCEPDLIMDADLTFPKNPKQTIVLYGAVYNLDVNATIKNTGEAAYQANMITTYHSDLTFDRVLIDGKAYPLWKTEEKGPMVKLTFPLANPIKQDDSVNVAMKFSVIKSKPSVKKYTITMEAKSIGEELDESNNKKKIEVGTKVETCVRAQGDASPPQILSKLNPPPLPEVNGTINATINDIGSPVNYTIYVQNAGQMDVESWVAEVDMAVEKDGVKLMCIAGMTIDNVPCKSRSNISDCEEILKNPKSYGKPVLEPADYKRLNCRTASCQTYSCSLDRIAKGKGASIKIMARILDIHLAKIKRADFETNITLKNAREDKDLFVQNQACPLTAGVVVTVEAAQKQKAAKQVPIWIIILAALGAIILLAGLVAVLYHVGFFKRNRRIKEITGPQLTAEKGEDDDDE